MGKTIVRYNAGEIIDGWNKGNYVYICDWGGVKHDSIAIINSKKITVGLEPERIWLERSFTPEDMEWFHYITKSNIAYYEDLGSMQTTPDARAMLGGSIVGGVGYGMASAMASVKMLNDVSVQLKTGKSCIIRFEGWDASQSFKRIFRDFEKEAVHKSASALPKSNSENSAYEQIMLLKELLGMGAITYEEFVAKRKQLLQLL